MSVWKQTASAGKGEGNFERAPAGNHPAVLVAILDMGTQLQEFQGDQKWQRRAYFVWELVTEKMSGMKDVNHLIAIDMTVSLNEKAKLRQWIEARTAKKIPPDGEYDISQELGKPCLLTVVEKNGYPKIAGVSAVPKGLPIPDAQHTPVLMSLDEFKAGAKTVPEWVPYLYGEKLADVIGRCKELGGKAPSTTHAGPNAGDLWDVSDGQNVLTKQTTAQVQQMLDDGTPADKLRVKPAGSPREQAKPAIEYGFGVDYAPPVNAGGEIPW